jgi:ABC-type multidrug transport system permease subunit
MRTVVFIGWTDLRILLKAKSAYIWLFVVPIVFIGFMGMAMRGPGAPSNMRPKVALENRDTNYLAEIFKAELGRQSLQIVKPENSEKGMPRIRIPADFTQRILEGKQSRVEFGKPEGEVTAESAMVELRLIRAVVAVNSHLVAASASGRENLSEPAVKLAQSAPATVVLDARFAGRKPVPAGFNFSLPGNMVTYIMMNLLIFGAVSIAKQRRSGVVRRIACSPVRRWEMIGGKIYGLVLLGGVQAVVFVLAGKFVFGVPLGANLGPILLTLVVYSWVAGSLGVLLGSVIHAEDKVVGVCVLSALLMGALGGGWWPLEIGPDWVRLVAHCIPTGWALDCLHQVITFGGGFSEILRPLAVLGVFGLCANALAAVCFRW